MKERTVLLWMIQGMCIRLATFWPSGSYTFRSLYEQCLQYYLNEILRVHYVVKGMLARSQTCEICRPAANGPPPITGAMFSLPQVLTAAVLVDLLHRSSERSFAGRTFWETPTTRWSPEQA